MRERQAHVPREILPRLVTRLERRVGLLVPYGTRNNP
jgi:hypothetical protein